jgi:hypothetical protein
LPWVENFDAVTAPAIPACMTVTNDNGDGVQWVTSTSTPRSTPNAMRISYNGSLAMDDWFFTPALALQPGTYNVSFWYASGGFVEALEVKWGTAPNAAGMTSAAIFDNNNITSSTFAEGTGTITITTAGEYYVGWHGYSDADQFYLKVDDISITEAAATKTLNLKAYIEGFWNGSGMNQAQDVDEDYNSFNKWPGTTVDTLSVYLAEATSPWGYVFAAHEVNISTDGSMSISVPAALSGNYYIVIDHYASIETWSAEAVNFSGTIVDYDFTTAADQAFGANQTNLSTAWGLYSGEVSSFDGIRDGYIDFFDVNYIFNLNIASAFGYLNADLTGDGFIDFFDVNIVYNNSVNSVGINTPPNPAKRPGFLKRFFK